MSSQKPHEHILPTRSTSHHAHHPSASDSEPPAPPPPPQRSNSELNLSVLQRHFPSTSSILSLAPYAVLYIFNPASSAWEKSGIEGTLFVCSLSLPPSSVNPGRERYAVTILNRRALENFWLELRSGEEVEKTSEYIILQKDGVPGESGRKVYGLWVFEEETGSTKGIREMTADLIAECATRAGGSNSSHQPEVEPAPQTGTQYEKLEQAFNEAKQNLHGLQQKHEIHQQAYHHAPQSHPQPRATISQVRTKPAPHIRQQQNQSAQPPQAAPSDTATPLFQTSADTQFFLSAPRIPKQPQPQNPATQKTDDVLGRLFQKAKGELASQT